MVSSATFIAQDYSPFGKGAVPAGGASRAAAVAAQADAAGASEITILRFRARMSGPLSLVRALEQLFPVLPPGPAFLPHSPPTAQTALAASGSCADAEFHIYPDQCKGVPTTGWYEIVQRGGWRWTTQAREDVPPTLEWMIASAAMSSLSRHYLLFHAGSMALHNCGLMLPAESGSGKSTLVAGLLSAGFQYLSDEVVVLEPASWKALPFSKCLCIKRGSRHALRSWFPQALSGDPGHRFGGEAVWLVPPPASALPSAPVPVRFVVFPQYVPGARTALTPIQRGDALRQMLAGSLNDWAGGVAPVAWTEAASGLAHMLQRSQTFTLTVGELDAAVELLQQLLSS